MEYIEWLERKRQRKAENTRKQELELLSELKEKYEKVDSEENRFTDNGNGTVTDNLIGLIWLRDANAFGVRTWKQALSDANNLASGSAGLTDGSKAGDWRLPTVKELQSLIDFAYYSPALSSASGKSKWSEGDAFISVQSNGYWSSTTDSGDSAFVWYVFLYNGYVSNANKTHTYYVWPVRGIGKIS